MLGWEKEQIASHVNARGWPNVKSNAVHCIWEAYKDEAILKPGIGAVPRDGWG